MAEAAYVLLRGRPPAEDWPLFEAMAKAQPDNAHRLFARERGDDKLYFSDVVTGDMCYRLMSAWALEYDDDGNGARREARLWGGIQVFAAYLDNQEFPSYNFDEAVE